MESENTDSKNNVGNTIRQNVAECLVVPYRMQGSKGFKTFS